MGTTTLNDTKVQASISTRMTSSGDLQTGESSFSWPRALSYTHGAGLDQANLIYTDRSVVSASGADQIDLSGTLADILGNGVVFARVKAFALYADPANTHNVIVGGATANGWAGPFGSTAHTIALEPGGLLEYATRTAAGWAVVNAASDILRVANGGTVSSVTYEIVLIGAAS